MNITHEQIVAVLRGEKVEIDGMRLAWRTVHPDFRSSRGFRWPFPGQVATADPMGREFTKGDPCPQFDGDGLCLALTWRGAESGGIPASTALICAYSVADVLGADSDKVRVPFAHVVEVVDIEFVIRSGALSGAYLGGWERGADGYARSKDAK